MGTFDLHFLTICFKDFLLIHMNSWLFFRFYKEESSVLVQFKKPICDGEALTGCLVRSVLLWINPAVSMTDVCIYEFSAVALRQILITADSLLHRLKTNKSQHLFCHLNMTAIHYYYPCLLLIC